MLKPPGPQVVELSGVARAVAPQDDQVFFAAHVGPAPAAVDPDVTDPLGPGGGRYGGGLVKQPIDGPLQGQRGQALGFLGRAAERRSAQQVACGVGVPDEGFRRLGGAGDAGRQEQ